MAAIVVVGASQGGVEAARTLIGGLSADFAAPVVIVLHIGSNPSMLPSILNDLRGLPASHVRDGDKLTVGHVHIAPPDHHLLIVDGEFELGRGPRENWARPAIDPLFRSAAEAYGPSVIGIVLTGRLNDGTAGLYEIKRRGGVTIVQDPGDAEAPSMPESALRNVPVDFVLPVAKMPSLLVRLVEEAKENKLVYAGARAMDQDQIFAKPSAQTCPECGGAMREEHLGSLTRFRCHIGHMMTAEIVAAAQADALENDISTVLRTLNERVALCRDVGAKYALLGDEERAEAWRHAAEDALKREAELKKLAAWKWVHPEAVVAPAD